MSAKHLEATIPAALRPSEIGAGARDPSPAAAGPSQRADDSEATPAATAPASRDRGGVRRTDDVVEIWWEWSCDRE